MMNDLVQLLQLKLEISRRELGLGPKTAPAVHNFSADVAGPKGGMGVGPLRTGRGAMGPIGGGDGGGGFGGGGGGGANVMTF